MNTVLYKITDPAKQTAEVSAAATLLKAGEVVAIPTETVYGLAANAFDPAAVKKIFEAKGRPQDNPLIVHLSSPEDVDTVAKDVPDAAYALLRRFSPGPLTVILHKKDCIPPEVSAGLSTVAVRIPSHPTANAIIRAAGVPLAAPSANLSGFPSPTTAEDVRDDMTGRVAAIVDGGPSEAGIESTVVTLATDPPRLLRPGVITAEQLREFLPDLVVDEAVLHPLAEGKTAASPGMKYKHYSPKAQIYIVKGDRAAFFGYLRRNPTADALLVFEEDAPLCEKPCVTMGKTDEPLTQTGRLFTALRELDRIGAKTVFSREPSKEGVGLGVCNRLYRAAGFRFLNGPPRIIGVCGQTGAGKSTVCARLAAMGAQIVDTDMIAREVVAPGSPVLAELAAAFGEDILLPDGALDRKTLAARAFVSAASAARLSAVTHPAIVKIALQRANAAVAAGKNAVIDAPLLFTAGLQKYCAVTVKVTAPEETRIARIRARDGLTEDEAKKRVAAQAEEDALSAQADHILKNYPPYEIDGQITAMCLL